MATTVVMEALSPTMEEGRVVTWHKKEGDAVSTGDVLAEVETDKAIMELAARTDGVLIKIFAGEGSTVPVGEPIGAIGEPGERVPDASAAPPAPATVAPAAPTEPAPNIPAVEPRTPAPVATSNSRIKASPLARRLAAERGVDLADIAGSGPGGRVVRRDVESARVSGSARRTSVPAEGYEDHPLSMMRKTIAGRLVQSIGPIPTFYLTTDIDMERAAEARSALNAERDTKVSFNDIIVKAVAAALKRHPECNAWWMEDRIRVWHDVHVGMAVAVEDGLITPVIRHADRKGLDEIGDESRELAARARARQLTPEEYTGATFSVSNLGMFDIEHFTAVINPPEAGILAIGAITEVPAVTSGAVTTRRRMRVTMSCDHRVIDGATGARFLQTLKSMLENPLAMQL